MEALAYLIPVALFLGLAGLGAFVWALKTGQFEDLDGAGMRILIDDDDALRDQEASEKPEQKSDTETANRDIS